jgi:5-methylcytosine-specific restriction endonuclease McrA
MKMLVRSKYSSEDQKEAARNLLLLKREREQKRIKKELMQERRKAFARKRDALLLGLIERDGYKCVVCCEQDNLSIDHITPLSKGGMDELNNLQLLCRKCNSAKGDRSIGRAEADKEIE